MPAPLIQSDAFPEPAARIDSPATLLVLGRLQQTGFIRNGNVGEKTAGILKQLT